MSEKWPDGMPIEKTMKTVESTQAVFSYPTGNVWREEYRNRASKLHRAGALAIVAWHPNNQVWLYGYYRHGSLHRRSGPAIVECDEQGSLERLEYYTHGSPIAPPPQ